jgi:hypothetical protein
MSLVPLDAGRIDVKISSAMKTSRKNICEILRNSGNLEWATNLPHTLGRRLSYLGIIRFSGAFRQ